MKKIFLALTGSIACIKAFDSIKAFQKNGFAVQVILTNGGKKFSSRLALESMTGFPVLGPKIFSFPKPQDYNNPFNSHASEIFAHLELSSQSEALVVAPCSANFLGKIVSASGDDFLSTAILAYTKPVFLAPAMNTKMWENSTVQQNIQNIFEKKSYTIIPPQVSGTLACGEEGVGKMATPETIFETVKNTLFSGILREKKFLINLGGTQEKIDPVRYIGNFSTGKTGKIFAHTVQKMGAKSVSLVSGNTSISLENIGDEVIPVSSAQEMKIAMDQKFLESDVVVFSAAVSDFLPEFSEEKIKKDIFLDRGDGSCTCPISQKNNQSESISGRSQEVATTIHLKPNIDIAQYFSQKKLLHQTFIGFALETGDEKFLKNALQQKAEQKSFDIILGNSPENIGTESGNFLVYFSKTQKFQKFSGKKSEIFEEVLTQHFS